MELCSVDKMKQIMKESIDKLPSNQNSSMEVFVAGVMLGKKLRSHNRIITRINKICGLSSKLKLNKRKKAIMYSNILLEHLIHPTHLVCKEKSKASDEKPFFNEKKRETKEANYKAKKTIDQILEEKVTHKVFSSRTDIIQTPKLKRNISKSTKYSRRSKKSNTRSSRSEVGREVNRKIPKRISQPRTSVFSRSDDHTSVSNVSKFRNTEIKLQLTERSYTSRPSRSDNSSCYSRSSRPKTIFCMTCEKPITKGIVSCLNGQHSFHVNCISKHPKINDPHNYGLMKCIVIGCDKSIISAHKREIVQHIKTKVRDILALAQQAKIEHKTITFCLKCATLSSSEKAKTCKSCNKKIYDLASVLNLPFDPKFLKIKNKKFQKSQLQIYHSALHVAEQQISRCPSCLRWVHKIENLQTLCCKCSKNSLYSHNSKLKKAFAKLPSCKSLLDKPKHRKLTRKTKAPKTDRSVSTNKSDTSQRSIKEFRT